MWDNFVGSHIRRSNRNLLLTNVAIVGVLFALTLFNGRYLFNFLLGPFPADRRALDAIAGPDAAFEYFVRTKGKQFPEPLGDQIEQKLDKHTRAVKSERIVAQYVVVEVDNKLLIVKVPGAADQAQQQFSGALVEVPPEMLAKQAADLAKYRIEFKEAFYPFMLDTTGFRGPGYWCLAIGLPLYALGMWNIVRSVRRMQRLERHPAAQALARHGDPAEIAQAIDAQLEDSQQVTRLLGITLTNGWLLRPTTYGLDALPLADLVWVYKRVTRHSTYGIPTGSTFAALILNRYGGSIEVKGNDQQTNGLLEEILGRAPWIIAGYSDELQGIWKSDLAGMAAAVDERRQEVFEQLRQQAEQDTSANGG